MCITYWSANCSIILEAYLNNKDIIKTIKPIRECQECTLIVKICTPFKKDPCKGMPNLLEVL